MINLTTPLVIFWDKIKVRNANTATIIIAGTGILWGLLTLIITTDAITEVLSENTIRILKISLSAISFITAGLTAPRTSQDIAKIKMTDLKSKINASANEFSGVKFKSFNEARTENGFVPVPLDPIKKKPFKKHKRKVDKPLT